MQSSTMGFKNGADTLLLGRINESTGIDQHHIGIVGLGGQFVAMPRGITEQDLCIDEIFGTAETDQTDFTGRCM